MVTIFLALEALAVRALIFFGLVLNKPNACVNTFEVLSMSTPLLLTRFFGLYIKNSRGAPG
jgi:hypothetical protein